MDRFTKTFVDLFQANEPVNFAACYPRHITPPGGFLNPRYFANVLRSELEVACANDELEMLPHLTGVLNCFKQLEYGVPTYFVRSEFAQAVAQTNPPKDFKFSEIKWPLDAMLFVLPTDFVLAYFGYMTPFISVVRATAGIYPDCIKLPKLEPLHPWERHADIKRLSNAVDRFISIIPCYSQESIPVDYTGAFNLSQNIGEIPACKFEDATYHEERLMNMELLPAKDQPAGDAEKEFHNKVTLFAVKLMLALTARPHVIKNGVITRAAKVIECKHPKTRDALWSPNTVGWEFKAQRPAAEPGGGGTHASPRLHWRVGHYHTVLFGQGKQERRLDWFEPCLVGAPEA